MYGSWLWRRSSLFSFGAISGCTVCPSDGGFGSESGPHGADGRRPALGQEKTSRLTVSDLSLGHKRTCRLQKLATRETSQNVAIEPMP